MIGTAPVVRTQFEPKRGPQLTVPPRFEARRPGRGISGSRRCRGKTVSGLRGGQRRSSPGTAQRRRRVCASRGAGHGRLRSGGISFQRPTPSAHASPGQVASLRSRRPQKRSTGSDKPLHVNSFPKHCLLRFPAWRSDPVKLRGAGACRIVEQKQHQRTVRHANKRWPANSALGSGETHFFFGEHRDLKWFRVCSPKGDIP